MLSSLVWILAGVTAWCVASLALALIVGPMIRQSDRVDRLRFWRRGSRVVDSVAVHR